MIKNGLHINQLRNSGRPARNIVKVKIFSTIVQYESINTLILVIEMSPKYWSRRVRSSKWKGLWNILVKQQAISYRYDII